MQKLNRLYFSGLLSFAILFVVLMIYLGIQKPKTIHLLVDNQTIELKTKSLFIEDVAKEIAKNAADQEYHMIDSSKNYINDGDSFIIQTKKEIEIVKDGETIKVTTFKNSVHELLEEINSSNAQPSSLTNDLRMLDTNNLTNTYSSKYFIKDIQLDTHLSSIESPLSLTHEEILVEKHLVEFPVETEVRYNMNLDLGVENVLQEGVPLIQLEIHTITMHDTNVVNENVTVEDVQQAGAPRIIEKGLKTNIAPAAPYGVWDELSYCEAGGRWNANTGNGYSGGLQWSTTTWSKAANMVGLGHIPYAYLATRDEQILAAEAWLARTSWQQWPSCSAKLGLQ